MDPVTTAFDAVPRAGFLHPDDQVRAGYDGPIPIGHGQTNSQPRTVAAMLRLLDVQPGQRVLDVGAGSGWTTALLGHLVGADGEVVGIERIAELAAWGEANLRRTPYSWARVHLATPGVLGDPAGAPYDRILVSAEAARLPEELRAQLADPGRMVLPVAGVLTAITRSAGVDKASHHGPYRFVPLVESPQQ